MMPKVANRNKNKKTNSKIEDFYEAKKTSFLNLLFSTKKLKTLFFSNEAKISIVISMCLLFIMNYLYITTTAEVFNEMLRNVAIGIFSALIGMLGFIISGMAITTGTVTNKVLSNINKKLKADKIISIIFTFYFVGALIGLDILFYIVLYLATYTLLPFSYLAINIFGIILIYSFVFIIVESVSLLGSCLRLLLVCFKFSDEQEDDK